MWKSMVKAVPFGVMTVRAIVSRKQVAAVLLGMALAACGGGGSESAATTGASIPTLSGNGSGATPTNPQSGSPQPSSTPTEQPTSQPPAQPVAQPTQPASGSGNTLGPAARFNSPDGIAVHANGDLFVVDAGNATIRKITPDGAVTTLAGSPGVTGSADGQGAAAFFRNPRGIAIDVAGNLYVADSGNHTIRKITPSGAVSTLAGAAGIAGLEDGSGAQARFNDPSGVAVDAAGNVYVADTGNYLIRRITPAGAVTTVAGGAARGFADGDRATASLLNPLAITRDGAGNLFITDLFMLPSGINVRDLGLVRRVTPAGEVTTLAGGFIPENRSLTDGTGSVARFLEAAGITVNPADNLIYVADSGHHAVRRVTPAGVVTTLALTGPDGAPPFLQYPRGIAADRDGNLYLSDTGNHVIRKIEPSGRTTIIAGREGEVGSNDRGFVED